MTRLRLAAFAASTISVAMALSACGGSSEASDTNEQGFPETLVVAAIPAENSTDLAPSFDPVIKLLEEETGAKVDLHQAADYAGVIEGMIAEKVDIAYFGPFSYVIATKNGAEIEPLGATIAGKGEPAGYKSYGLTQGDNSEVNDLSDFAGKDVCFVDPGSTSGFLYPSAGLIDAGVIKSADESEIEAGVHPVYAGAHDASALAIKNGDCEAGFAMSPMVDHTLPSKGELKDGDLKKVWTSETIAGSLFAARKSLGKESVEKLATILVEKSNADYLKAHDFCTDDCLITSDDAWGVAPAKDSDYDGVRKVCDTIGSDKCE